MNLYWCFGHSTRSVVLCSPVFGTKCVMNADEHYAQKSFQCDCDVLQCYSKLVLAHLENGGSCRIPGRPLPSAQQREAHFTTLVEVGIETY